MKKTGYKKTAVAAAALLMISAAGCAGAGAGAQTAKEQAVTNQITVTGKSSVNVVPDTAKIVFSVNTEGASAEETQKENTEKMNQVIEVLKSMNIDEKSLRTSDYSMYPQYDYGYGNTQQIIGYQVGATLTVSDQKIEDVGTILTKGVQAGINSVSEISFSSSQYDEKYQEALRQAIDASNVKAEALAKASGKTLGEIKTVTEGYEDESSRYYQTNSMISGMTKDQESMVSIQPGEQAIRAEVNVTYELK
ncbi:MAG: SIMPL domain-containing protein [Clostridium sp.]|nr:SIMPL domain-containing protein [Clostridium sp.]